MRTKVFFQAGVLTGAGRVRTERQGTVSGTLVFLNRAHWLAGVWLEQQGSSPRGTQLLSIGHRGSTFHRVCIYLSFCQGKK